jgi:hypothetical protein
MHQNNNKYLITRINQFDKEKNYWLRPNRIVVFGIGHRDKLHYSLIKRKGMDGVGTNPCVRFFLPQQ